MERRPAKISNVEIKAGVFLTFCLALFVAMLFVLGHFSHTWSKTRTLNILFTQIGSLCVEAPVQYDGLDVGRVKRTDLKHVDEALLKLLRRPLDKHNLASLPLKPEEIEALQRLPDGQVDFAARQKIIGHTMILVRLEVQAMGQRFCDDDEYCIGTDLMGNSLLEVHSGNGAEITDYKCLLLGNPGNMYTDLSRSLGEVKDILSSMTEIVSGTNLQTEVHAELENFDHFTARLDDRAEELSKQLPRTWDNLLERMDQAQDSIQAYGNKLTQWGPQFKNRLAEAQKTIRGLSADAGAKVQAGHEQITATRRRIAETLLPYREQLDTLKDSLPGQIREAREWSERLSPTVERVETWLKLAAEDISNGEPAIQRTLANYNALSAQFEQMTYRLSKWPWAVRGSDDEALEPGRALLWQRDLARRQYKDLRDELAAVAHSVKPKDASDKERLRHIERLRLQDDQYFGFTPAGKEQD